MQTRTHRSIGAKRTWGGLALALALGGISACGAVAEGELDGDDPLDGYDVSSDGSEGALADAEPATAESDEVSSTFGQARQALRQVDPDNPGGSDPPGLRCFDGLTGSFRASATSIALGQSLTLSWSAKAPTGCSAMRFYLGSSLVSASGSSTVQPQSNATYSLRAVMSGLGETRVGSATVAVTLPSDVTISANNQTGLLVQALRAPGTRVTVQNHVNMDLSYIGPISIASNVTLRGGRTPMLAGPRLFSALPRGALFSVDGDNVRISGLRIEGPDMGASDGDFFKAIAIENHSNLEVDNNELSGWSGAAVSLNGDGQNIGTPPTTLTARVHDNFIHHNQHVGTHGYGVVVGNRAYASIQRNVFDWNRHAIAGDGSYGSGYQAVENLVLQHGGLHRWIPIFASWVHTHQFDMHGQENCGVLDIFSDSLFNCGPAGHDVIIRFNAFLYTEDNAIKLRGTPTNAAGMAVGNNVFAHDSFGDAADQTESGLRDEGGNRFGIDGSGRLGSCDLDGDGIRDSFMATGQTWWYSSRGELPWSYLNTSTRLLNEVSLGDFNGDNRCDVLADGVVFSGGKPPSPWLTHGSLGGVLIFAQ